MKKESTFNSLKIFLSVINKYNVGIFIVLVAAGLMFCILIISDIVNSIYDSPSGNSSSLFDQTTINKLDNLSTSDHNPTPILPRGRIDPFHE